MNKKELRHAFNQVLSYADSAQCKDLHHKPKQRHSCDVMCPSEYELQKQVCLIREFMKENNI